MQIVYPLAVDFFRLLLREDFAFCVRIVGFTTIVISKERNSCFIVELESKFQTFSTQFPLFLKKIHTPAA